MNEHEIMLGNVHDLRTPINGIKGHVHYLKERLNDKDEVAALEIIEQCCQDMEQLISNILEQDKLKAGLFRLEQRGISIRAMVDRLCASFNRRAGEKGLSILSYVEERVPDMLVGDEYVVSRMIGNLINNAIKYTTIGGIGIYVDCEAVDNHVLTRISVVDTGEGILDEWQESIFGAYGQDESVVSHNSSGTGLGLYLVRQMAKLLDGDVSLKSEKGQGSTFTVSIMLEIPEGCEVKKTDEVLGVQAFSEKLTGKMKDIREYGSASNKNALLQVADKLRQSLNQGDVREADSAVGVVKLLLAENEEQSKLALKLAMAVRGARKSEALGFIKDIEELYEKQV